MTREVTLTRLIDAPRALVWAAWIEPERMAQWWGPHHFTNPVCEMDVGLDGTKYLESDTIVTLEEQGTRTRLTVKAKAKAKAKGLHPMAPQMFAGMDVGWSQSLEKLETLVAQTAN